MTVKQFFKTCSSEKGFTLVEVMIALAVFTIGILAVNAMQTKAISINTSANKLTLASSWASDRVERIFALDYDDPLIADTDGDGNGNTEDADDDGVDDDDNLDTVVDDNENFGLHHDTDVTADGTDTSPDNSYTIFWNVADNIPMPNTKTIHIIVNRTDLTGTRSVIIKYIKARYM